MSEVGAEVGADFALIHGSCFGSWCWQRVIPALQAPGHRAHAIDLPRRNYHDASLRDQAQAILARLTGPTILVAHSAGGVAMTAAAEMDPQKVAALVWLCAYLPDDGASVASLRRRQDSQPLRPALRIDAARGCYDFAPEAAEALFFHDCPEEDRALAAHQMAPEAIAPQEEAVAVTERSLALPRYYITCDDDRAIPPEYQRKMATQVPEANRLILACGHAPFFARPAETAALLHDIAQSIRANTCGANI
ncbi:alpha/beta fold hydrolase [Xinfangfangia sp. D13-10-4-6]|uniref:alpha/beta fold hydrolase n=1 Tax=Pseudogemmobacter hezensis TaxID=2737662 RepID=UPI0015545075|nr:alpha/beta fold hydrolase [Pseudogemmobacter hezensis]NPD13811.1 alpha/beta fold hydrolase [Pseudogemmobacter hezensis]